MPRKNATRRVSRCLPAIALILLATRGSGATVLSITVDPPVPTWRDLITLTVKAVGCGNDLTQPTFTAGGVRFDLHDSCPLGVLPAQITAVGHLLDVPPGTYDVTVADAQSSLTISVPIYDVSPIGIAPFTLATSSDTTPLDLVVDLTCLSTDSSVSGDVVNLQLGGCPFEPPPPRVQVLSPPIGPLAPGTYAVRVFDHRTFVGGLPRVALGTLHVRRGDLCFPADDRLCLHDGRFAVTGHWRAFDGSTGPLHAAPLDGGDEGGTFWFFSPDNTELTVKVLDGCAPNGHWWAFLSSASTVEYEVTVTDVITGHAQTYGNELGHTPALLADTSYEVCP